VDEIGLPLASTKRSTSRPRLRYQRSTTPRSHTSPPFRLSIDSTKRACFNMRTKFNIRMRNREALKILALSCVAPLALGAGSMAQVPSARWPASGPGEPVQLIAKPVHSKRGSLSQPSAGTVTQHDLYALSCSRLWYQRNAILWAAGYCFDNRRAVRIFGNAACAYHSEHYAPLTEQDRQLIDSIRKLEKAKDCTD